MNNYLIRSTGERFEKKIQDSTRKRYDAITWSVLYNSVWNGMISS